MPFWKNHVWIFLLGVSAGAMGGWFVRGFYLLVPERLPPDRSIASTEAPEATPGSGTAGVLLSARTTAENDLAQLQQRLDHGQWREAVRFFHQSAARTPQRKDRMRAKLLEFSSLAIDRMHTQHAITLLSMYLQTEYLDFAAYEILAEALFREQDYTAAIQTFYQAKQQAVRYPDIERITGRIRRVVHEMRERLRALNQLDELLQIDTQLAQADPAYAPYVIGLAETEIAMQRYINAEQTLQTITFDPAVGEKARRLLDDIRKRVQPPNPYVDIPVTRDGENYIVQAFGSESVPLRLLIDTGASMSAINSDTAHAQALNLHATGDSGHFLTANGLRTAPLYVLDSLSLGEQTVENLKITTLDMPGERLDGILGMNFLKHYQFFLDQEKNILRLYIPPE